MPPPFFLYIKCVHSDLETMGEGGSAEIFKNEGAMQWVQHWVNTTELLS